MRTHHGLYDSILEADEEKDMDRHKDLAKAKLTLTECILALALAVTFTAMHADFLGTFPLLSTTCPQSKRHKKRMRLTRLVFVVEEIEPIIHRGVSESFMGIILIPLVEKLAEHLTAIDEAWDNQMNFALAHVLGATIQTALFVAPLIVVVGWGLHKSMDLGFSGFQAILLILAIIAVSPFCKFDQLVGMLEAHANAAGRQLPPRRREQLPRGRSVRAHLRAHRRRRILLPERGS